jgi:hypothetical protein
MRAHRWKFFLAVLLTACSSSAPTPERAAGAPDEEQQAAAHTDACLDNPELARRWGDCNVKHTVYLASADLEKCRGKSPGANGTVSFELRVAGDGSVKSAKALGGAKGKHTACVAKAFRKLRFAPPPRGKAVTITVPYQSVP